MRSTILRLLCFLAFLPACGATRSVTQADAPGLEAAAPNAGSDTTSERPDVLLAYRGFELADDGSTRVTVAEGQIRVLPGTSATLSIADGTSEIQLAIAITKDDGLACGSVALSAGAALGTTCADGAPLEVELDDPSRPLWLWVEVN